MWVQQQETNESERYTNTALFGFILLQQESNLFDTYHIDRHNPNECCKIQQHLARFYVHRRNQHIWNRAYNPLHNVSTKHSSIKQTWREFWHNSEQINPATEQQVNKVLTISSSRWSVPRLHLVISRVIVVCWRWTFSWLLWSASACYIPKHILV